MGRSNLGKRNGREKSYVVVEHSANGAANSQVENTEIFDVTVAVTPTAAGAAVNIVPDAQVRAGRFLHLDSLLVKVAGGTSWTTTATLTIEGTDGTDFLTIAVAALVGNAQLGVSSANVTQLAPFYADSGGVAGYGLQVKADVNAGAGSTTYVRARGRITG